MDTPSDMDFRAGDEVARRLREGLGSHVAVLSLFLGERQIFLGTDGLPALLQGVREIPLLEGFCKYVRDNGRQLIVDDVREDTGIATHPLVGELGVESYAGWHVPGEDGRPIGVLCAMDDRPRQWSTGELTILMDLAHECGSTVRTAAARVRRGSAA